MSKGSARRPEDAAAVARNWDATFRTSSVECWGTLSFFKPTSVSTIIADTPWCHCTNDEAIETCRSCEFPYRWGSQCDD